jgi:hypothetical protein
MKDAMKTVLFSALTTMAVATTSHATTLVTPPITGGEVSHVVCAVTSLKKSGDLKGSVVLYDTGGNLVDGNALTNPPGATVIVGGNVDDSWAHCVIEIDGPKSIVRASACVVDDDHRCIAAVPAQ